MSVGPISSVVVGVTSLDECLELFHGYMGIPVISAEGTPTPSAAAEARSVTLGFPSLRHGRLRLVERQGASRFRDDFAGGPHTAFTPGAKALDFYVHEDIAGAVRDFEAMGYLRRSDPVRYQVGVVDTEELLLSGPDGLPMMLMYPHDHPATSLQRSEERTRFSQVATVSVITSQPAVSRRFYVDGMGLQVGTDSLVSDDLLDAVGRIVGVTDPTPVHMQLFFSSADTHGKYLLIHFPELADPADIPLQMSLRGLGVNMYTHVVADPASTAAHLLEHGGTAVDEGLVIPGSHLVRGPNGELIELVGTERRGV